MTEQEILQTTKEKMDKSIAAFKEKLTTLRTGHASIQQFEKIPIECYNSTSPLKQLSNISSPEPRLIVIQAWDTSILPNIEKALQKHTISLNPHNDGKSIRIQIPPLTDQTRQDSIKLSKRYEEEAKIAIRNLRRDANEKLKKLEQLHEISKDQLTSLEQEIQKHTDQHTKTIEELQAAKAHEISEE